MNNRTFDVAEAKKHFPEILGRVAHGGERITISKKGKPLAVLVPPSELPPEDNLGKAKGWLENDDPFFKIINQIVHDRKIHPFKNTNSQLFLQGCIQGCRGAF